MVSLFLQKKEVLFWINNQDQIRSIAIRKLKLNESEESFEAKICIYLIVLR